MKWIVQEMLNSGENVWRMKEALERNGIEHLWVRVDDKGDVKVLDKELMVPVLNSESVLNRFVKDKNVLIYGSKALSDISEKRGWVPGSFINYKFDYEWIKDEIGEELLNGDVKIGELADIEMEGEKAFIRPSGNNKLFTGQVLSKDEWMNWKKIKKEKFKGNKLVMSEVKDVGDEYRFFVVGGEVVSGSSYKFGDRVVYDNKPNQFMIEYVEKIVKRWCLAEVFVVDVAEVEGGYKIVEYNNFSTSAWYGCDEEKIINAIESCYKREEVK